MLLSDWARSFNPLGQNERLSPLEAYLSNNKVVTISCARCLFVIWFLYRGMGHFDGTRSGDFFGCRQGRCIDAVDIMRGSRAERTETTSTARGHLSLSSSLFL